MLHTNCLWVVKQSISWSKILVYFMYRTIAFMIMWNHWQQSSIESLNGSHSCGGMIGCVIPEFNPWKKRISLSMMLVCKTPKTLFNVAINHFWLSILLRMIDEAHLQLHTWHLEEFLPKMTDEHWVSVAYDRLRHSMKLYNSIDKFFSYYFCCMRMR